MVALEYLGDLGLVGVEEALELRLPLRLAAAIPTKLIIPPGPNNPVGLAWVSLALTGYGMHGTPRPEDIGRTESHGCFRLHNWNALRLAKMVLAGIPVTMIHAER